jgi:hypothetical protein
MMRQTVEMNRNLYPMRRYSLGNPLRLFCAQKVRNPRFTIHKVYVSPLWGLINQSKELLNHDGASDEPGVNH